MAAAATFLSRKALQLRAPLRHRHGAVSPRFVPWRIDFHSRDFIALEDSRIPERERERERALALFLSLTLVVRKRASSPSIEEYVYINETCISAPLF